MKNLWMVRAGEDAILIEEFKSRNIVAIGWRIGDLSDKSEEEIKQLIEYKYSEKSINSIANITSQIVKFKNKIKIDDYVLTFNPSTNMYSLGMITSDYYYSEQFEDLGEKYKGYNDTRNVKWLGEIPKDELKDSTKSTLGASTTLFNINKNAKTDIFNVFRNINEAEYDNSAKIIRDYLDENNLGNFEQEKYETAIKNFYNMFSPEILEKLEGVDLLNKLFIHDGEPNNLCYNLEFTKEFKIFGGIGGGSAFKYYLYKSSEFGWRKGPSNKNTTINEEEAIQIGTKIRDAIVSGAKYIKNAKLDTIEDYKKLEHNLNQPFLGFINIM